MRAPSLSHNIRWALAGNAVYALSQWAVLVAVARAADPATVGTLAYAIALVAPATALASLQLRVVMMTDAGQGFAFCDFLQLRLALLVVVSAAMFAYAAYAALDPSVTWTIAGVLLWRGLDGIAEIYYGRWQAQERAALVSQWQVLNGVISIAALSGAVAVWPSAPVAAFATASGSAITLVFVARVSRLAVRNVRTRQGGFQSIWGLARLAAPLGFVAALLAVQGNAPRYVIESALGSGALGIFAAASQLPLAGGNIVSAVATVAGPRLVRSYTCGAYEAFWRLLAGLAVFGLVLGLLGATLSWAWGREILNLVYGVEYGEHAELLVQLSVVAGLSFAGSFLGHGMTMGGEFRSQAVLFALVLATTFGACYVLVPRAGLSGAVIGMGVGHSVQIVGSIVILWRAVGNATNPRDAASRGTT